MKHINKTFIFLVAVFTVVLSSCAPSWEGVKYVYEKESVEISFPLDMKVFELQKLTVSDTDIEKYGFEYNDLKKLSDPETNGIVYYGKSHDLNRECTLSVTADDNTLEIWDFTQQKTTTVSEFAEMEANRLTTSFYTIAYRSEYRQGNCYFVRFDMRSSKSKIVDTIIVFTVKNGLKYVSVYYSSDMNSEDFEEAENIFKTFNVTKTLELGTETNALVPIVLVVGGIVVITLISIGVFSLRRQSRKEKESADYSKQFKSVLEDDDSKSKTKDKKGKG